MDAKYPISFYQSLGNLFYAISASDKRVDQQEINRLKELIATEWERDVHLEHLEKTFNRLMKEQAPSAICFDAFVKYKNENRSLFSDGLNRLILHTAGAIASSFSKRNKSELMILAKLTLELRN